MFLLNVWKDFLFKIMKASFVKGLDCVLFCTLLIDGWLLQVTSPYGNNLHHSENVTHGQVAFTTSEAGNYLSCFWLTDHKHEAGVEISVNLDWRNGIAAKDWESVARKEKIEVTNSSTSLFYISLQLPTSILIPIIVCI